MVLLLTTIVYREYQAPTQFGLATWKEMQRWIIYFLVDYIRKLIHIHSLQTIKYVSSYFKTFLKYVLQFGFERHHEN